jgi:hypothetical protein
MVSRFGGDEFMILAGEARSRRIEPPGPQDPEGSGKSAISVDGKEIKIGFSMGLL